MFDSRKVTVFLDPITQHFERDRLFEQHPYGDYHTPFLRVREVFAARGVPVHTADLLVGGELKGETNMYFALGRLGNYRSLAGRSDVLLCALFHFEAPIVHPSVYRGTPEASSYFKRIYSFSSTAALAPFGCGDVALEKFCIPQPFEDVFDRLWERRDRKFLALVSQNKLPVLAVNELYTERLRALEHFSRTTEIDLYGIGWDKMPFRVGERRLPRQVVRLHRLIRESAPFGRIHPYETVIKKVYRGAVASKYETLSGYTFALCYENMILDGWVNEKIFDAFLAGTIPIYLGAPDITDYVPEECFIDKRKFSSYGDLGDFLRSLSPADVQTYKDNAREYLRSSRYRPFTKDAFAELFVRAVEEDVSPLPAAAFA
jgi:alpha(1,3/1,4) fucosyltransferase